MRIRVFAVIDTNVIVSSIISDCGFPAQVVRLTQDGNIIPIFDGRILDEYYHVLHYPKFHFSEQIIYNTLRRIVENGIFINDVEQARIELKDKGDIPFFEVKESSQDLDSYLVTGISRIGHNHYSAGNALRHEGT